MNLQTYMEELSYRELVFTTIFGLIVVTVILGLVFTLKAPKRESE